MNHPFAIAAAPGGFGYVADSGNHVIRQFFPTGDGIETFTPFLGTVAGSAGIAGSSDGTGTAARFSGPAGIAVLPDFTVFVSDTAANRIRRISPTGVVTSLTTSSVAGFGDGSAAAARFNGPTGLAVDRSGNLFIADTGNNVIRRLGTDGIVTTIAGTAGVAGFTDGRGTASTLNGPTALAFDASGNLYVADTGNNAIRQVAPSGLVTTMIGTGSAGHANGPGRTAMLSAPTGLAVDAAGRLVIADGGNRVVRLASPAAQPPAPVEPKPRRRAAQH
jgi:sugar lactone lactonase YvrE